MIDFIKIVISDKNQIESIWNNHLLEFYEIKEKRISIDEVKTYNKKSFKNLIFEKFYNRLEISGSIHKFKNNGIHNANQFSFIDSINTISELKDLFNLDLKLCKIINLEYGLNLIPDENIKNIILWLRYHNKNAFFSYKELRFAKLSAKYNKYHNLNKYKIIKAYAKGFQFFNGKTYGHKNTFRFEVKSKESKYINSLDVHSLNDLIQVETYFRLSTELIKEWNNVLLLDMNLKTKNNKRLNKYLNSDFWENSINEYRNHFSKHKKKYLSLLDQYPGNLFERIQNLIESKLNQLQNEIIKKGANSTSIQFNKGVQIQPNIKLDNAPLCILTGIDISMQKENSILISHTGLKYLYNNNQKEYNRIKNKHLSKKWIYSDLETEIKELAHNIRNKKNYLTNRNIDNNDLKLF